MPGSPNLPIPCCSDCLPAHRGDWEVRPNPRLLTEGPDRPCAYCGSTRPSSILTVAAPVAARARVT
ncbi:MAG TPA: hypothetical protein VN842_05715 [Thermoplasmata archaeon]|nr:hypothetical protein [Thermoplasmata archaeon]